MKTRRGIGVAAIALIMALGIVLLGTDPGTVAAQQGAPGGWSEQAMLDGIAAQIGTTEAEIQEIEPVAEPTPAMRVAVRFEDREMLLDLERYSMRAPGFRMLVQVASGEIVERDAPTPRTYRGTVEGAPESRVALSLDPEGRLQGMILTADGTAFGIEPVSRYLPGAPPSAHVVYRVRDLVLPEEYLCGADEVPPEQDLGRRDAGGRGGPEPLGTGLKICDIGLDADREFFQLNGSNENNTIQDIESVMNLVENIYERDTQITYEITVILVRTAEPDPYSSSDPGTLLAQFQGEWNTHQSGIKRDVAHLMTGKDLSGSVIGIAQLSVICTTSQAYGLSQSRFTSTMSFRAGLTAHELGHNWSATHCSGGDCRIMCATLGGCSGDVTRFGNAAKNQIIGFRNTRTCLVDLASPVVPPFQDLFPSNSIDTAKWSYVDGGASTGLGSNEPSPLFSLNLDSTGAGANDDDEIRSNEVLLSGTSNVTASFYTEHRGPAAGETLTAEYWGSNGRWNNLVTVTSDGTTQDWYQFQHILLPSTARHDSFRLRFVTDGNGVLDDWFVDNVAVCPSEVLVTLQPHSTTVPRGGQLLFDAFVTNLNGSASNPAEAWVDVVRPDGSAFSTGGNPKFGPKSVNLNPGQVKSKLNIPLNIPSGMPAGTGYRMIAVVGDFATSLVCNVSEFQFEVTP